jgi:hypothetical protein
MLTPEAGTDLLLAVVCGGFLWREWRRSPGIAVAMAVLGLAATFGVLRFSDVSWVLGPHQFLVLVSSTAAMPLLAWSLRWPASLPALQPRAACMSIVFGGALGVVIGGLLDFKPWRGICLLISVGLLLVAAWNRRQPRVFAGVALLVATGAVQTAQWSPVPWPPTAIAHVLLALGLVLCLGGERKPGH